MSKQKPTANLPLTKDWKQLERMKQSHVENKGKKKSEACGSDHKERTNCQGHEGMNTDRDQQDLTFGEETTDGLFSICSVSLLFTPQNKNNGSLNVITALD